MAGFCFNRIGACSELVCFEWPLGLHSRAEILFSCQASLATVGGGAPLGWVPQLIKNEACCCLQTLICARPPGLEEARSPCGCREASKLVGAHFRAGMQLKICSQVYPGLFFQAQRGAYRSFLGCGPE